MYPEILFFSILSNTSSRNTNLVLLKGTTITNNSQGSFEQNVISAVQKCSQTLCFVLRYHPDIIIKLRQEDFNGQDCYYLFLLLKESSLCLSSASSSCSSCSASRWVFSSLSRTPSGLRCRIGPERLMERLVQRLRDGEPTSMGPGIDRFSVDRLAKKWRTSTGLKILGELHGDAWQIEDREKKAWKINYIDNFGLSQ